MYIQNTCTVYSETSSMRSCESPTCIVYLVYTWLILACCWNTYHNSCQNKCIISADFQTMHTHLVRVTYPASLRGVLKFWGLCENSKQHNTAQFLYDTMVFFIIFRQSISSKNWEYMVSSNLLLKGLSEMQQSKLHHGEFAILNHSTLACFTPVVSIPIL